MTEKGKIEAYYCKENTTSKIIISAKGDTIENTFKLFKQIKEEMKDG